jgi:hypothetical protein
MNRGALSALALAMLFVPGGSAAHAQGGQAMANMPGMNMQRAPVEKHKRKKRPAALAQTPRRMGGNMQTKPDSQKTQQSSAKHLQQPMDSMRGMSMPAAPGEANRQPSAAAGQAQTGNMPGMNSDEMTGMDMPMTGLFGNYSMSRDASGTSWQPDLVEHHALHAMVDDWMLMGHLMLLGVYDTQSGPRGDDKLFGSGMLMGSARRDFSSNDLLNLRIMLSPEPFMGRSGYPLLLQTGETANGVTPLIDRQHPHDLFMELSATYAHKFSSDDSAFIYAGYPGEPALGPPAFMHRASGMDNPAAPITHHWLDSTHITFGVVTAGFVHDNWKLEVSQFTGREPNQQRFDFDKPQFDSTSARVSYNPDEHWALQASYGHLHSPEELAPGVNEDRYTASAMYVAHLDGASSVSATLAWGLKRLSNGSSLNGLLLESEYKPCDPWTLFARGEWEENNEIAPGGLISGIGEVSLGAIRDFKLAEHWKAGLGALYAFDLVPARVVPTYGTNPHGAMVFFRIAAQ